MIYLILSIILTSYLTLSFKVVQRYNIPVFQAIVFNYITCVVTGSIVNGSFPLHAGALKEPWAPWALLMGCLFVSLFNLIGFTTQKLGVAVASVANKLSLVIPFLFSIYFLDESSTVLKIIGVVLALVSVLLTCWPQEQNNNAATTGIWRWALPLILFAGSGLLDTSVKWVEHQFLNEANNNSYLIAAFATAATVGSLLLIVLLLTGKQKFDVRSIAAGIAIGVPNYFSIWCLVKVLKQYGDNSSAIIPINNMGIVLFSTVVAAVLFKEALSVRNWAGIALALIAIALIAFG